MRRAFTLVELLVVIGLMAVLMSVVLPNFLTPVSRSSFASTLEILTSNIRSQQLKSIQGSSTGSLGPVYRGIRFNTDNYVLFSGQTYSVSDPANTEVDLDPALRISFINLPGSEIIFAPGSGAVSNFVAPAISGDLTLVDVQSGLSTVIVINQYGVVTQIY
jgi:prepilin-type N-terminal cleavage/methylation domain-containing protein